METSLSPSKMEYDCESYDPKKWKDCGLYWLYDTDQGDPDWLLVRRGRPSGSNCSACIGHNTKFSTPDQAALEISGRVTKEFTPQQKENMAHGTKIEPEARSWYEYTKEVEVKEIGFVVPKWDLEIGVSIDGDVIGTDGMIEIKGPKRMYGPLSEHMARQKTGYVSPHKFSHIWISHYDQMQLGMVVLNKKWCDYVVYCTPEDKVFVQRIPFDQDYWSKIMYPKIRNFTENKLKPLLVGTPFPLMPSKVESY